MPLRWDVDHAQQTVIATGHDVLSYSDIQDYLDGLARSATRSYRKLLNLSGCTLVLSKKDLVALGDQFNAFGPPGAMGAAAIVVASEDAYRQVQFFQTLTATRRPLTIFREAKAACQWLASQQTTPRSPADLDP